MTTFTNVQTPSGDNTMLTRQCENYKARMKGHGSTFMKHEIPHLSHWPQMYIAQHYVKLSSPHHACNEKGGSP